MSMEEQATRKREKKDEAVAVRMSVGRDDQKTTKPEPEVKNVCRRRKDRGNGRREMERPGLDWEGGNGSNNQRDNKERKDERTPKDDRVPEKLLTDNVTLDLICRRIGSGRRTAAVTCLALYLFIFWLGPALRSTTVHDASTEPANEQARRRSQTDSAGFIWGKLRSEKGNERDEGDEQTRVGRIRKEVEKGQEMRIRKIEGRLEARFCSLVECRRPPSGDVFWLRRGGRLCRCSLGGSSHVLGSGWSLVVFSPFPCSANVHSQREKPRDVQVLAYSQVMQSYVYAFTKIEKRKVENERKKKAAHKV